MLISTYFHSAALFLLLAFDFQPTLAEDEQVAQPSFKRGQQEDGLGYLKNDLVSPTRIEEGNEPLPSPTKKHLRSGRKLYHQGKGKGKGKGKAYDSHGHHYHNHYPIHTHTYHTHYPPYHPPQPQPPPSHGRRFYIRHIQSGLYLDNSGGQCYDGNNIHLWSYHGGVNQIWYEGANNSIMSAGCHNMVIDIEGGSCRSGANVQIWPYHGRANQQFMFNGHNLIENYNCGVALFAAGGSHNGGNVMICNNDGWGGAAASQWEKIYV